MIVLCILIVIVVGLLGLNYKSFKDMKKLSKNDKYDAKMEKLPSNIEVCKECLNILKQKENIVIETDEQTKKSAYIFFKNKIILSDTEESKKGFSRILFIAHECIHSVQSKKNHIINFTIANIKNLYDVILFILLLIGKASIEMIFIEFLLAFISFYFRILLETDAVYRSVWLSRKYLEKYDLEYIANEYEIIVPKTIDTMYFMYIVPIFLKSVLMMSILLIRS